MKSPYSTIEIGKQCAYIDSEHNPLCPKLRIPEVRFVRRRLRGRFVAVECGLVAQMVELLVVGRLRGAAEKNQQISFNL